MQEMEKKNGKKEEENEKEASAVRHLLMRIIKYYGWMPWK